MATREATKTDCELAARVAAIASAGAGLIHLAVMPTHWSDWWLSGLFFSLTGVMQILWALRAWKRPAGWVLGLGIALNAGIVMLWVITRTAGVPFGPHAGDVEAVEAAGICAVLLECYVVMAAAWSWMQHENAEPVSALGGALVLVGANTVIMGAVVVGMASSLQGHHHQAPAEALREQQHTISGHHHSDPAVPPVHAPVEPSAAPAPGPEDLGLPVTDMALHADERP